MAASWTPDLIDWTRAQALSVGFDLAGVAPAYSPEEDPLTPGRFSAWIDAGHAGEMNYLKRKDAGGELLRRAVRVALPWARSVLVCAFNYNAEGPRSIDAAPSDAGWIARYAWNGTPGGAPVDYHDDLLDRLHRLEAALCGRAACQTKCYVDTGPLLERDLAAKAGIGWIGKNTCVLNQGLGSWLLLGVIATSLETAPEGPWEVAEDRCGSCTRCLEACPTGALIAPRQMDASLCISYLTIEKKGAIPEALRERMGRQIFGCDICQDVCPWNRRAPVALKEDVQSRTELINPPLDWLAGMDDTDFRHHFQGSPLERTKRARIQRNTAIAMGNSGRLKFTPALTEWSHGSDPVLAEAAGWALDRLQSLAGGIQRGAVAVEEEPDEPVFTKAQGEPGAASRGPTYDP